MPVLAALLAHGGEAVGDGPNPEFIFFGVALVVLALVFFFQKTVKPQVPLFLLVAAAAVFAGAFAFH